MRRRRFTPALCAVVALSTVLSAPVALAEQRPVPEPPKRATAVGTGGAAATIDPLATAAAIDALRGGANAIDAAVAAAGVLGVTEAYSAGIGGGGFMTIYRASTGRVTTIDSREAAPAAFGPRSLVDAAGAPLPFNDVVTSGLSVGVPGTAAGWDEALDRYGTWSLRKALRPGIRVAERGFEIDAAFNAQTTSNAARFNRFATTRALYLTPAGTAKPVGAVQRNPDLAETYRRLADEGPRGFYEGRTARAIVDAVRTPPLAPGAAPVRAGLMDAGDLEDYEARLRRPTKVGYRGLDVYGMAPPSSGGSTIGEALNILEGYDQAAAPRTLALHRYLEASKLAYADRGAYIGDPEFFDVPLNGLLSEPFAAERRALISDTSVLPAPQPPGDPFEENADPSPSTNAPPAPTGQTTHLTVSDRQGNVVSYTFTIEQIGGSGIVAPRTGMLLNNELTDFNFAPGTANSPEPGKRPRSSMAPTLVLRDGKPYLSLGSPGGSTIITTVLQVLLERVDLGKPSLPAAIDAPRVSSRNTAAPTAEPAFLASPEADALEALGWTLAPSPDPYIGLVAGIEFLPSGRTVAAAEPAKRRGGGAAAVVRPG